MALSPMMDELIRRGIINIPQQGRPPPPKPDAPSPMERMMPPPEPIPGWAPGYVNPGNASLRGNVQLASLADAHRMLDTPVGVLVKQYAPEQLSSLGSYADTPLRSILQGTITGPIARRLMEPMLAPQLKKWGVTPEQFNAAIYQKPPAAAPAPAPAPAPKAAPAPAPAVANAPPSATAPAPAVATTPKPATPAPAAAAAPGGGLDARYAPAIRMIESGSAAGNYRAVGKYVPRLGDRAYGAYQVMGKEIPQLTKQYAGQAMTPEQFLANPKAQDAVFNGEFGRLVNKYGPERAAHAWFAGERGMQNLNATDIHGRLNVSQYGRQFMANVNAQPNAGSIVADSVRNPPSSLLTQDPRLGLGTQLVSTEPPRPPASIPSPGKSMAGVNPRLVSAVQGGASYLPPGYSIQLTSGKEGRTDPRSHHSRGNAVDVQIIGPNGPIPNSGADTTGMYTQLARGVKTWATQNDPQIASQIGWGGAFGTQLGGGGVPDLMHFDLGGSRGNMRPEAQFARLQPLTGGPSQVASVQATDIPAGGAGVTVGAPTDFSAQKRGPVTPTEGASGPSGRSALAESIIKGYGPRAELTTYREPATGIEVITGRLDGESIYRPIGRTPGGAQAAAGAPATAAPGAAPAGVPLPKPRPSPEDPEAKVYQRDMVPPAPAEDPEAKVYQRNMTPPDPFSFDKVAPAYGDQPGRAWQMPKGFPSSGDSPRLPSQPPPFDIGAAFDPKLMSLQGPKMAGGPPPPIFDPIAAGPMPTPPPPIAAPPPQQAAGARATSTFTPTTTGDVAAQMMPGITGQQLPWWMQGQQFGWFNPGMGGAGAGGEGFALPAFDYSGGGFAGGGFGGW